MLYLLFYQNKTLTLKDHLIHKSNLNYLFKIVSIPGETTKRAKIQDVKYVGDKHKSSKFHVIHPEILKENCSYCAQYKVKYFLKVTPSIVQGLRNIQNIR